VAAKLIFLVALALNSAFVMDEYWMVVRGLFGLDHLYKDISVFQAAVVRLPHLMADWAVEIMLACLPWRSTPYDWLGSLGAAGSNPPLSSPWSSPAAISGPISRARTTGLAVRHGGAVAGGPGAARSGALPRRRRAPPTARSSRQGSESLEG